MALHAPCCWGLIIDRSESSNILLDVLLKVIIPYLQHVYSSYNKVHISSVTVDSGGIYRCEVSNEKPDFETVSKSVQLAVTGKYSSLALNLRTSEEM